MDLVLSEGLCNCCDHSVSARKTCDCECHCLKCDCENDYDSDCECGCHFPEMENEECIDGCECPCHLGQSEVKGCDHDHGDCEDEECLCVCHDLEGMCCECLDFKHPMCECECHVQLSEFFTGNAHPFTQPSQANFMDRDARDWDNRIPQSDHERQARALIDRLEQRARFEEDEKQFREGR